MRRSPLAALMVASACAVMAAPAGAADAERGAKLHASCLGCHGTELYVAPRARVKSLKALRKAVEDWNDRYNPKFGKKDVEDLVAYLNRDFYKFP